MVTNRNTLALVFCLLSSLTAGAQNQQPAKRASAIEPLPRDLEMALSSLPALSPVTDVTNRLNEIAVTMLLIWPSRDSLSPITIAHAIAARARDATIMTFDSSDHWVAHQFPAEIAAAIVSFAGLES